PAGVVGHAAAEAGRHGGRPERAAAGRGGDRRGRGRRLVQGEADGGAGEGVAVLVGGRRPHRVGAVGLRRPGGQRGAARPGRGRAAGRGDVRGRQADSGDLPAGARPVEVVRGPLQREGG